MLEAVCALASVGLAHFPSNNREGSWTPWLLLYPGEWKCGFWQSINQILWHTTLTTLEISLKVLFPNQTFTFDTMSSLCFAKTLFEGYSGITDWFVPQMWWIPFPSDLKNQKQTPGAGHCGGFVVQPQSSGSQPVGHDPLEGGRITPPLGLQC